MEIRYLSEFLELASKLNFTEAAENLYISQPVLSKHIKSLEKELGLPLFERGSKQVSLTAFGTKYAEYARKIVQQYESADNWRREYIRHSNRTIRVGLPESQELYEILDFFRLFRKLYPEYTIETTEHFSSALPTRFEEGSLNLFLTGMTADTDISSLPFGYVEAAIGHIKVCLGRNHPYSSKTTISVKELENDRVVLPPHDSLFQIFIEDAFFKALSYRKEFLYSSYTIAKMLAEAGTCVALLQEEALTGPLSDNLIVADLEPDICYTRGLGYNSKHLNEAEHKFLQFIKEQLSK